MSNKTKILFISRHGLLKSQKEYLKKALGDYTLTQSNKNFKKPEELINLVKKEKPDYIIPILPLPLVIELLNYTITNGNKPVIIRPEMELLERFYDSPVKGDDIVCMRMFDEEGNVKYRVYKFKCFKILEEIIVKERIL